jgi:ATP-dependent Zn protease
LGGDDEYSDLQSGEGHVVFPSACAGTAAIVLGVLDFNGSDGRKSERVVYHEAGHAIVGRALGDAVASITVEPREIDGRLINGRVRWVSDDGLNDFNRCIVLVAGGIAERMFCGETRGLRGTDRDKARKHASEICETEKGIDHLIGAAKSEADRILIENSFLVEALVDQLRVRRTMTGREVESCIADVEAAKVAASWLSGGYLSPESAARFAREQSQER